MTTDELQSIVTQVISSIRTNSKTIEQLSAAESLTDDDYFEINGGRKVSYAVLSEMIASLSSSEQDSLKTLVNKNVLKSVSFTVGESSATLAVSSTGTTISCSVPVATDTKAGIITAADKVKITTAYDKSTANASDITSLKTRMTSAESGVSGLKSAIGIAGGIAPLNSNTKVDEKYLPDQLKIGETATTAFAGSRGVALETRMTAAESAVKTAQSTAEAATTDLNNRIGKTIAPLENGSVPAAYLPSFVDDVVEIGNCYEWSYGGDTTALPSGTTTKKSTDAKCQVVYIELWAWVDGERNDGEFGIFLEDASGTTKAYYSSWDDMATYCDSDNKGYAGKIYVCKQHNKQYRWGGSSLVCIGDSLALGETSSTAYPGNLGAELATRVDAVELKADTLDVDLSMANTTIATVSDRLNAVAIVPFDGFYNSSTTSSSTGTWFEEGVGWVFTGVYASSFNKSDYVEEYLKDDGSKGTRPRSDVMFRCKNNLYRYDGSTLVKVGGASVGNCYNVTNEVPHNNGKGGYYTLSEAVTTTFSKGMAAVGMQITFAIAKGSWKTYQYVGETTDADVFKSTANWIDLAGLSAGKESVLNINDLVGTSEAMSIGSAIEKLIAYETKVGIAYRKAGLVITYLRNASTNTWETKQYIGAVTDMTSSNTDQWKDFGGGSDVEATDKIEEGSTKAITSGAVYNVIKDAIVNFEEVSDADYIIFQGVNRYEQEVGDPIKIPRSNGTGTQTGTVLSIYCDQAVWAAYGSSITLDVALKSVSYDGDNEVLGTIKTVSILDGTTRLVLWTSTVNTASSTSSNDRKFVFDFTDFVTSATSKDFVIQAVDADGNTKSRTITVNAVDVTCTAINRLNYAADYALTVGSTDSKSIPMYKFANNISTSKGIRVTTEMYYNGEWKVLGTAVVVDSYSHNISINPSDVFGGGEKLTHGSYPIRINGVDVASGVKGNTVYTAVMCIDASSSEPVVSMHYDDNSNGTVRLYDSVAIDIAAYTPGKTSTTVNVYFDGKVISSTNCGPNDTYQISQQIQGYATDGSKTIDIFAQSGSAVTETVTLTVSGSAIDAVMKDGAVIAYDFSTRSNSESDHTIKSGNYTMSVKGSNWNSNGFVKVLGETTLRIAENVKAEIPYAPFSSTALETAGCAVQFAFSTKSIKDKSAKLMSCYDASAGVGFYITGNKIVLTCLNGKPTTQKVGFKCSEKVTVAVVVEPGTKYVTYTPSDTGTGENYAFVKLYVNGEECAAIGYRPSTNALRQNKTITFDSTNGDFALNYFIAYNSYMEWLQAFQNYLCKMSDVKAMIAEYDKENVLDSTGKPSMSLMSAKGIPYYVIVADQTTFNNFDYALNGGTSTSDQFSCTLYYFNPDHPECNFKAVNVLWRRQGTTSAQRPIKNDRFNFNKKNKNTGLKATVTLLNPDDSTALGRDAVKFAKEGKVFCHETGFFIDTVTVKVDYSDSSNANDCGVCNMMNATFRALGSSYMTPAQRAFIGKQTFSDGTYAEHTVQMDHSTKNHPIAVFRATSDTLQDAWFHAKGNWKEDKGEQIALGFKDTLGYNKGCLNYGDFVEFFGTRDEALADTEKRFLATSGLDTSKVYLISQYCGRDYAVYRCKDGVWTRSTGSMKMVNGEWVVTGDVLNPVSGYELLQYSGMDWWQGVSSIDDMMAMTSQKSSWAAKLKPTGQVPAWTYYFECMIDDDQLQQDLVDGKKVPYELYNMLRFFNSCDYSKVDGWQTIWKQNAYRYMSLESAMAYTAFTDYLAAVDQRAKNMQPMFYLEDGCSVENGVYSGYKDMEPLRMYLNKVYDCDTCNGKDNDGGLEIDPELDPNKDNDEATGYENPYMGRGSVLFNNIDKCQELWNSNDLGATTITLKNVVSRMRNLTTQVDGKTISPFSPDGALYYFVESILEFWPKVVSSYDGERKYIDNTNIANQTYFYALHGLGLTSLPRFIEQRWAIRDGYYQTGDFFTNPLTIRMVALSDSSTIGITAAATGYFGIGNDAGQTTAETVYLEAGESHEFTLFDHGQAQQRIYMPGRLARLDLSQMSLASADFSSLELCEELVLGGDNHTSNPATGFGSMTSVSLGTMPFLRKLDVRYTTATSIDASACPRVEEILADSTSLTTCSLAQTSPIDKLTLPATITSLVLVNLPELTYPGGLTVAGFDKIAKLWVEGCENINVESVLKNVASSKVLTEIRITDINMTAASGSLYALKNLAATGLDANGTAYDEKDKCSGIVGRWIMSDLLSDTALAELAAYFPLLTLYNSQFSAICYSDTVDDTANITNVDDSTGYKFGSTYTVPAHWSLIESKSHAYKSTYSTKNKKMTCVQISDSTYEELADGSSFDPADASGGGFDVMKYIPKFYMKGVNDYKNQEKYTFLSALGTVPLSTANKVTRKTLSSILVKTLSAVFLDEFEVGEEYYIADNANMNVYSIDVEGMKQVRFPGVNSAEVGAAFVDENGKVISKFSMQISTSQFDFVYGDYLFTDVPAGAKTFVFTCYTGFDTLEAIAVDSSEVEAIEPDWVECGGYLLGVYGGYVDSLLRMRSISSVLTTRGTGTSGTNSEWAYDSSGNLTNTTVPTSTMNYTGADLINMCRMRGAGFQAQDWNMNNELAQIIYGIIGNRDSQAVCGNGCTSGYTTGAGNSYGNVTRKGTSTGNLGNIVFGIQNYYACAFEWMDYLGINISDYISWRKLKYSESDSSFPTDGKWHIYDPIKKSERLVQGLTTGFNYCIGRMKHGRYCDMVPSKVTSDSSLWNKNYADKFEGQNAKGRLPLRAGFSAFAYYGLAYVYTGYGGSPSYTYNGVRLAFRGEIDFV
jgi:hypothetical protein